MVLPRKLPLGSLIIVHLIKESRLQRAVALWEETWMEVIILSAPSHPSFRLLCLPFSPRLISCLGFLLRLGVQGEWAIVSMAGRMGKPFELPSGPEEMPPWWGWVGEL